jgi:hypothetical protein
MTELQLPDPPYHPSLHRAAGITLAAALAGACVTLAITGASAIGWIADVPWLSRAAAAVGACGTAAGALEYL